MEIKLNIDFQHVAELISELPWPEKLMIRDQLEEELKNKPEATDVTLTQLLLSGPVMSKEGYEK